MKRNPKYRLSGKEQESDDMTEILSSLVADAMENIESKLSIEDGTSLVCTVKPVTDTMVNRIYDHGAGRGRSHKEGLQAFASSLFDANGKYEVAYAGHDNGHIDAVFMSRSSLSSPVEAARDAMAKAVGTAIEEGVVLLTALYSDSGRKHAYPWEVWVSSLDAGVSHLSYVRMTYGVLPPSVSFEHQFEKEIGDGKLYKINNKGGMGRFIPRGESEWYAPTLWRLLVEMVASDDDDGLSVVGDILGTLGIEWV